MVVGLQGVGHGNTADSPFNFTSTQQTTTTVGATSTKICEASRTIPRQVLIIRNNSAGGQTVTLSFGLQVAVAGSGVVLSAGQTYMESNSEGFECFQGQISAVASAAGALVTVMER